VTRVWSGADGGRALLGAKPAQLVRMLVLNGARRVIAEHHAALAQPGTARKSVVSPGA
jgi:hypothetical protein